LNHSHPSPDFTAERDGDTPAARIRPSTDGLYTKGARAHTHRERPRVALAFTPPIYTLSPYFTAESNGYSPAVEFDHSHFPFTPFLTAESNGYSPAARIRPFTPPIHRRFTYKGDTSTHAQGTDSRVALPFTPPIHTVSLISQLKATATRPRLEFDRSEIILPAVPLGHVARGSFYVVNNGYDNLELQCRVASDAERVPIKVLFPGEQRAILGCMKLRLSPLTRSA